MPIADEPISPERLKELQAEKPLAWPGNKLTRADLDQALAEVNALSLNPHDVLNEAATAGGEEMCPTEEFPQMQYIPLSAGAGVQLTNTSHPECRMTRMMEIVVAFWEKMGLHKTEEPDFHDFEKAFHTAAHEYAVEAAWTDNPDVYDRLDKVELKKWAFQFAMHEGTCHGFDQITKEADRLLAWLLKP